MITKNDIKIINVQTDKTNNTVIVNYEILVLKGIKDTIVMKGKANDVELKSELIPNLNLPRDIEKELIIAIVEAIESWNNRVLN